MDDGIEARIRRLYSAVEATSSSDLSDVRTAEWQAGNTQWAYADFRGGLSAEQLHNVAHTAIMNVANLRNHLYAWAGRNGKDAEPITEAVRQSWSLRVMIDLANNERHSYPPKPGASKTGQYPRLIDVDRAMTPAPGVPFVFLPTAAGLKTISGSASLIITGTIVDQNGVRIGDFERAMYDAVEAWEKVFAEFGLLTGESNGSA